MNVCVRVCVCVCVYVSERWREREERKTKRQNLNDCWSQLDTGWRRLIRCLKLQVIFCKRATKCRVLLRKMTYEDKASYDLKPPCRYLVSPGMRKRESGMEKRSNVSL